jgi:hypothetical protein
MAILMAINEACIYSAAIFYFYAISGLSRDHIAYLCADSCPACSAEQIDIL